jgi:hypothetical protein
VGRRGGLDFVVKTTVSIQLLSPLFIMLAAIMRRVERRLIARMRESGATSPERAQTLDLSRFAAFRLRRLTAGGAIVALADGRYYFSEPGWRSYRAARKRRALAIVGVVLAFGASLFFLTR